MDLGILALICAAGLLGPALSLMSRGTLPVVVGPGPTLVYAVVIGSSSAAVALPVIQEARLDGPAVLAAMAWITIADVAATVAISLALTPSRAPHAAGGALVVTACVAVHVAASRVIRARPAIGLLASAQMGVPAAVIALGLPSRAIDQAQASAIFCAALVSIGACAAAAATLRAAHP